MLPDSKTRATYNSGLIFELKPDCNAQRYIPKVIALSPNDKSLPFSTYSPDSGVFVDLFRSNPVAVPTKVAFFPEAGIRNCKLRSFS